MLRGYAGEKGTLIPVGNVLISPRSISIFLEED